MLARRIKGANVLMAPPPNWDETRDGACIRLWVRYDYDTHVVQSAWEPTPDELRCLNAGGSVILSVVGGQPPVMLYVEPQE